MYFFYNIFMPSTRPHRPRERDTLSLKIGAWFEAQATGWGILAAPVVLILVGAIAVVRIMMASS